MRLPVGYCLAPGQRTRDPEYYIARLKCCKCTYAEAIPLA